MVKLLILALLLYGVWLLVLRPLMTPRKPGLPRDEQEARALLGVEASADADAIRAAHRRLVTGVHPDRGGSAELTRRVNAARDLLLRR